MKAIVFGQYRPVEVLRMADVPMLLLKPDQVVICSTGVTRPIGVAAVNWIIGKVVPRFITCCSGETERDEGRLSGSIQSDDRLNVLSAC